MIHKLFRPKPPRVLIVLFVAIGVLSTLLAVGNLGAITVDLDYSHDTFFSGHAMARAAIEAAASDISAAITSSLGAVTNDVLTGTYQRTSVTFDWEYSYTNPTTDSSVTIPQATVPADVVTIFVGGRNILGTALGHGGPGGIGLSLNGSGFPSEWPNALADADAQSDVYRRGGGPLFGTLSGSSTLGNVTANYSVDYGVAYGNLWFDLDSDNNNVQDPIATLDNYWHWNHTTPVGAGKNDLYSVAVHEILHSLGVGTSASWDNARSGTTWNGADALALTGGGANLVAADGAHIASSVMSTRLSDGAPQEVVMDPSLTTGTRKELTALDLAFLRDIGWETIIPNLSSADFNGDGSVDGDDFLIWQSNFGTPTSAMRDDGDSDGDGDVDGDDFLAWQAQFGSASSAAAGSGSFPSTPEPAGSLLACLAFSLAGAAQRLIGRRGMIKEVRVA